MQILSLGQLLGVGVVLDALLHVQGVVEVVVLYLVIDRLLLQMMMFQPRMLLSRGLMLLQMPLVLPNPP